MNNPAPTEINLHRLSRVLELSFDDGSNFKLPAEYLRVYSPVRRGHGPRPRSAQVPIGKEDVNIDRIEPVGNYAVCLHFDDEHNTGIYSWETLYNLGKHFDDLWAQYLEELKATGHQRKEPAS